MVVPDDGGRVERGDEAEEGAAAVDVGHGTAPPPAGARRADEPERGVEAEEDQPEPERAVDDRKPKSEPVNLICVEPDLNLFGRFFVGLGCGLWACGSRCMLLCCYLCCLWPSPFSSQLVSVSM